MTDMGFSFIVIVFCFHVKRFFLCLVSVEIVQMNVGPECYFYNNTTKIDEISTLMKSKIEISCLQTIKNTIKILTDVPRQSFLMEYVSGEGLLPKYTTYNNDRFQMFTKPENEKRFHERAEYKNKNCKIKFTMSSLRIVSCVK